MSAVALVVFEALLFKLKSLECFLNPRVTRQTIKCELNKVFVVALLAAIVFIALCCSPWVVHGLIDDHDRSKPPWANYSR